MSAIVIAGGTGLLGTALTRALRQAHRAVLVLTRRPTHPHEVRWSLSSDDTTWMSTIDGAHAVINLAGTSIATGRWTAARKKAIRESRLLATRALVRAVRTAAQPPPVFASGSAIGFYGQRGETPATEQTPPGSDFLARLCVDWEAETNEAAATSRVIWLRTGMVLAREGGALPPMALPFRLFAGGPVGTGRQPMSWIHLHDWVEMVIWALTTPTVTGALNVTAPAPVTNAEFARTLGRVLRRPAFIRTPAFPLRLALGEMADALILEGRRVLPEAALQHGFVFRYPTLEAALRQIYSR
jgi:uncharacterized protein (TIGR01777 family)